MGNQCEKHFCNQDHPNKTFPNWMKSLPDSFLLTKLTIPGTHNSCSFFGTAIAITQTWSIPHQLNAGIRYFDIRLRRYDNTLRLQHGIMDQKCTFDVILKHFKTFLFNQPSEVIIMAVQHEYKPSNSTKSMEELFNEYTAEYKDIITPYIGKDIEIGDIRGKILFINVFHSRIHWVTNVVTQNEWVVNFPSNIKDKKRKVKTHFNQSVTKPNDGKIHINYLSGVSDYGIVTPARCAEDTNGLVFKYKGRIGVVLCDFPGEELIEYLIEQNYSSSPAPMQMQLKGDVCDNAKIGFVNVNTKKYLALNEANEFCCTKGKFYYTIVLKKDEVMSDTEYKDGQVICDGDKVKLMSIKNIFQSEIIIHKVYPQYNKQLNESEEKGKNELRSGDIVYLCTMNQFLCSSYNYKVDKEQKVKMTSSKAESENEWVIEVLKSEENLTMLQE